MEVIAKLLFLLFRFLFDVISESFFMRVFWFVGWPFMRFFSCGKFPRGGIGGYGDSESSESVIVCGFGLVFLFVAIVLVARYLIAT